MLSMVNFELKEESIEKEMLAFCPSSLSVAVTVTIEPETRRYNSVF